MSGLEVVALVVGIVSAFSGTASFLRELKKKKKDESSQKPIRIQRLQKAVELAPPEIQQEYDHDFARIGRRFAVGDDHRLRFDLRYFHPSKTELDLRSGPTVSTIQYCGSYRQAAPESPDSTQQ
ncbi:hypothetical protein J4E91_000624 [Alternaria rosae]|nr:hypothetical protein J4E91_000624 [Alternaria rosae]